MTNLEREILHGPHDLALPLLQGCKLTCSSCDDNEARRLYSCTAIVHCAGLVEALCLPINEMGCMQLNVFLQLGKPLYSGPYILIVNTSKDLSGFIVFFYQSTLVRS